MNPDPKSNSILFLSCLSMMQQDYSNFFAFCSEESTHKLVRHDPKTKITEMPKDFMTVLTFSCAPSLFQHTHLYGMTIATLHLGWQCLGLHHPPSSTSTPSILSKREAEIPSFTVGTLVNTRPSTNIQSTDTRSHEE